MPCMKKYGMERFRARVRTFLHRVLRRDPEEVDAPILKHAQDPWDWD